MLLFNTISLSTNSIESLVVSKENAPQTMPGDVGIDRRALR